MKSLPYLIMLFVIFPLGIWHHFCNKVVVTGPATPHEFMIANYSQHPVFTGVFFGVFVLILVLMAITWK